MFTVRAGPGQGQARAGTRRESHLPCLGPPSVSRRPAGGWRATELREVGAQGSPLDTPIPTDARGRLGSPAQEAAGRLSSGAVGGGGALPRGCN